MKAGKAAMWLTHKGFDVEFITLEGETLVVISLFPSQIRTVQKMEIPHVRLVA
jgi:hypothetical protein